jgi:two-component system nitrate/nitrite sensor histidine kinase NarX
VREGILALRSQPSGERSFEEVLADFLDAWSEQAGIEFELTIEGGLSILPSVELQLLCIIQESLANVRKHARATSVRVAVQRRGGRVVASVADDGVGFDPERRGRIGIPRFGLSVMRERTESIGGSLSVNSRPGEGTRVTVEVPDRE